MKRFLILSASSGAGHIRAAHALEKAFNGMGEVKHEDSLTYTSPAFRNVYSKLYIEMVNSAPTILGWLYNYADIPWKNEKRRLALDRLNMLPLIGMLQKYKPDVVVCTHFLPAEIISWLICRERLETRLAVVVTDFDVHAMWLCHHYSYYFVPMEETKEHLQALGFEPNRVFTTGIPIDPVFAVPKDKTAMRAKYGLERHRTTIYMSLGGFGVGPVENIVSTLSHIKHKVQVLAMCGKNTELKERLDDVSGDLARRSNLILKPVGYTTAVDEYMAASDIVLGKPGGLTTSEALARNLVFVVVNPIPGQEERNSDHLLEEGVAIRCNNLPTLAYKLDKLLDDPTRLEQMKLAAHQMARPTAAQDIARILVEANGGKYAGLPATHHQCDDLPIRAAKATKKIAKKLISRQA